MRNITSRRALNKLKLRKETEFLDLIFKGDYEQDEQFINLSIYGVCVYITYVFLFNAYMVDCNIYEHVYACTYITHMNIKSFSKRSCFGRDQILLLYSIPSFEG